MQSQTIANLKIFNIILFIILFALVTNGSIMSTKSYDSQKNVELLSNEICTEYNYTVELETINQELTAKQNTMTSRELETDDITETEKVIVTTTKTNESKVERSISNSTTEPSLTTTVKAKEENAAETEESDTNRELDSVSEFDGIELKYSEPYNVTSNPLTASMGVKYYNGHRETWYSQKVLPGNGLKISGRHVADDGTIRDGDGYIVVASDLSYLSRGSVILTSLGPGKVYDTGCAYGTIDIYVNW